MQNQSIILLLGVFLAMYPNLSGTSIGKEPSESDSRISEKPEAGKMSARKIVLTVPVQSKAEAEKEKTKTKNEKIEVRYWLYLPKEYDAKKKPLPLLLFLHGSGERGDDINRVKIHGPLMRVGKGADYPFLIIAPQRDRSDDNWRNTRWRPRVLKALVEAVSEEWNVDQDRLYITGLSMGGFGTWDMITQYPNMFAAAAPICGGGDVEQAARLKEMPLWVFHGEKDLAVPVEKSKTMVEAVNKAGGNAKLTLYPNTGHNSWIQAYDNPKLAEWFLKQRRKSKKESALQEGKKE